MDPNIYADMSFFIEGYLFPSPDPRMCLSLRIFLDILAAPVIHEKSQFSGSEYLIVNTSADALQMVEI